MKQVVIALGLVVLTGGGCLAADQFIRMSADPLPALLGETVRFQCDQGGDWRGRLRSAKITIKDPEGVTVVSDARMTMSRTRANYDFVIPSDGRIGNWDYQCVLRDRRSRLRQSADFTVAPSAPVEPPPANHSPVAMDDSASTEFQASVAIDVLSNDEDVDSNLDPASLAIVEGPPAGSVTVDGDGSVVYTPAAAYSGAEVFVYEICDTADACARASVRVDVAAEVVPVDPPVEPPVDPPVTPPVQGPIAAHNTITSYEGPATCIGCHEVEASEMLQSLHMQWSGPTPELTNTNGEPYGKSRDGINTFCTYAMSSKSACFSCHVRADGNAPDAAKAEDVDCLMCHNDTYQRTFEVDPKNTVDVTNVDGENRTYVFGKVDDNGNYNTVPDYGKMPEGTTMVNLARTVHMPTNTSCLRCHAKAGGGDWTKRGDMGLNSADATVEQDVHLAKDGAGLSCVDCHSALNHKIAGRGIDLRQTEAAAPTCGACHTTSPHSSSTLNRHAGGQVSCQVCHIRTFAKGGATEMSRDWSKPTWNAAFCSGQGGYVGEEVKEANVKPEYVWWDGTSYVYNVGETIEPDEEDVLHMARANGAPFDGKSQIVPIKRHFTNMPLDSSGRIIPPAIMWMFMTGNFDRAVQEGLADEAARGRAGDYTGSYTMYPADAEMLITHGVDPVEKAPSCVECHDGSGSTSDGSGILPFGALGYHELPARVRSCDLCHERESMGWESMHQRHRADGLSCNSCHTPEPTGLTGAQSALCSSCHERKSWRSEGHKKHIEKGLDCSRCHTFS